jgi:hypothetical protein
MTLAHLLNQPLTIQTMGGTTTDEYGNTVLAPAGDPVPGVGLLDQKDTIEFLNGRQTVVTKWKAFLPAGTVIGATDYINFDAQKFQVDGEPWPVYNPRTRQVSHIECTLVVTT